MIDVINTPDHDEPVNLAELNRRLAAMQLAANRKPDPEMGGLSPDQVHRLIYTEWGTPASAIQFNTDVPLAELASVPVLLQIRTLLTAIQQRGGVRATATRNLNREFVAEMLPEVCDEDTIAGIRRYFKAINEQNVWPLHRARIIAHAAGMICFRKGHFSVPKGKVPLLADERAGALFTLLLGACFQKYNFAYRMPLLDHVPALQACAGFTLYRLGVVATEWTELKTLWEQVLLPVARRQVAAFVAISKYWEEPEILSSGLLRDLVDWGLLEGRDVEIYPKVPRLTAVRITPLYKRVLMFRI